MEVRDFLLQGLLQNVLAKVILEEVTIFNLMEKVSNIKTLYVYVTVPARWVYYGIWEK